MQTDLLLARGLHYLRMVSDLPRTFNRLMAEETLEIGGRSFEVLTGAGHSSEQVMLYCAEGGFILCADQAMARISPNISVEAINPNGDPLGAYLRSLAALKQRLPADVLALPGHNLPFVGLPTRIDELIAHHQARCAAILKAVDAGSAAAIDLVPVVFGRTIDDPHQMSFAFGEALAHVNYLVRRKELAIRPALAAPGRSCEAAERARRLQKNGKRPVCFLFVSQTTLFDMSEACKPGDFVFNESCGPGIVVRF